jgi:hypothetical protein
LDAVGSQLETKVGGRTDVRALGPVAGLLGGLCWVARWVADLTGTAADWADAASWVGLGLLAVALAVVGAGLVSRSALWLRLIVAVAFPLLVWSIYSVVRGEGSTVALDGAIGLLAVVLSLVYAVVGRRGATPAAPRRGSHAAR